MLLLPTLMLSMMNLVVCSRPRQVHLSLFNNSNDILVTWLTIGPTNTSMVTYYNDTQVNNPTFVFGSQELFSENSTVSGFSYFIHKVPLLNMTRNVTYRYRCGSNSGWSAVYSFYLPVDQSRDRVTKIAMLGDINPQTQHLTRLQESSYLGHYDLIINTGDVLVNNTEERELVLENIEPIAAYTPYMITPGCLEEKITLNNSLTYKTRFSLPGAYSRIFTSYNLGPIHFASFASDYWTSLQPDNIKTMYELLEQDLKEANKIEQRKARPWIIVYGHIPPYCLSPDNCNESTAGLLKYGLNNSGVYGLDQLYRQYDVDMCVWGRGSGLVRFYPETNSTNTTLHDKKKKQYDRYEGVIHIVSSTQTVTSFDTSAMANLTAYVNNTSSRIDLTIYNGTHAELVGLDMSNNVIDKIWLTKYKHGNISFAAASKFSKSMWMVYMITAWNIGLLMS